MGLGTALFGTKFFIVTHSMLNFQRKASAITTELAQSVTLYIPNTCENNVISRKDFRRLREQEGFFLYAEPRMYEFKGNYMMLGRKRYDHNERIII